MALTVTNISQGNTAQFIAEFLDSNGNLTVPSGATLNITYPTVNVASSAPTTASTAMAMSQQNSFFTATWLSCVASPGLAPWNIVAIGSTVATASGFLRIILP